MKDNLILHHDTLSVINELTDEQAGLLIKEIFAYSVYINNPKEAKEPSGLSGLLNSVAHPFKMQLDRDLNKYSKVVERNAKNGQKGGRPKKEETQKKPTKPKKADSVKDSDSDKESDSDINMLENEFQECWKNYTLTFLKSQGRGGGTKKNALAKYKALRSTHSLEDTIMLVNSEMNKNVGHRDLERVLTLDNMKQIQEDGMIQKTTQQQPMSFKQQDQQDTRNKVEFSLENNIFDLIDEQSQQNEAQGVLS